MIAKERRRSVRHKGAEEREKARNQFLEFTLSTVASSRSESENNERNNIFKCFETVDTDLKGCCQAASSKDAAGPSTTTTRQIWSFN